MALTSTFCFTSPPGPPCMDWRRYGSAPGNTSATWHKFRPPGRGRRCFSLLRAVGENVAGVRVAAEPAGGREHRVLRDSDAAARHVRDERARVHRERAARDQLAAGRVPGVQVR